MKIALTGTPGTGKTSVANKLALKYKIMELGEFKEARVQYDEARNTYIVDLDYLRRKVEELENSEIVIIVGHYAHEMPVDIVIVLRCHPDELRRRLAARNYSEFKIMENVEAEAMGIITEEALAHYSEHNVYEIDTTDKIPAEVASAVEDIISGNGEKYKERISYMEEILKWY